VPGLHASFWHGLWAPKGTPKDVIASLHAAVVETLADPLVRQRLADLGVVADHQGGEHQGGMSSQSASCYVQS
jgi:tripartite-type tricarboxylate transporter receptor subunit TctC